MKFARDDGIVIVFFIGGDNASEAREFYSIKSSNDSERSGSTRRVLATHGDSGKEFLRRNVAREEALRNDNPALWRKLEIGRQARNSERAAINRRLRAEGRQPVELEPSLAQRMKKLQQLEARNKAESAKRAARS